MSPINYPTQGNGGALSIATAMTLPRSGLTLQIAQTPDGRMIIFGGLGRAVRNVQ